MKSLMLSVLGAGRRGNSTPLRSSLPVSASAPGTPSVPYNCSEAGLRECTDPKRRRKDLRGTAGRVSDDDEVDLAGGKAGPNRSRATEPNRFRTSELILEPADFCDGGCRKLKRLCDLHGSNRTDRKTIKSGGRGNRAFVRRKHGDALPRALPGTGCTEGMSCKDSRGYTDGTDFAEAGKLSCSYGDEVFLMEGCADSFDDSWTVQPSISVQSDVSMSWAEDASDATYASHSSSSLSNSVSSNSRVLPNQGLGDFFGDGVPQGTQGFSGFTVGAQRGFSVLSQREGHRDASSLCIAPFSPRGLELIVDRSTSVQLDVAARGGALLSKRPLSFNAHDQDLSADNVYGIDEDENKADIDDDDWPANCSDLRDRLVYGLSTVCLRFSCVRPYHLYFSVLLLDAALHLLNDQAEEESRTLEGKDYRRSTSASKLEGIAVACLHLSCRLLPCRFPGESAPPRDSPPAAASLPDEVEFFSNCREVFQALCNRESVSAGVAYVEELIMRGVKGEDQHGSILDVAPSAMLRQLWALLSRKERHSPAPYHPLKQHVSAAPHSLSLSFSPSSTLFFPSSVGQSPLMQPKRATEFEFEHMASFVLGMEGSNYASLHFSPEVMLSAQRLLGYLPLSFILPPSSLSSFSSSLPSFSPLLSSSLPFSPVASSPFSEVFSGAVMDSCSTDERERTLVSSKQLLAALLAPAVLHESCPRPTFSQVNVSSAEPRPAMPNKSPLLGGAHPYPHSLSQNPLEKNYRGERNSGLAAAFVPSPLKLQVTGSDNCARLSPEEAREGERDWEGEEEDEEINVTDVDEEEERREGEGGDKCGHLSSDLIFPFVEEESSAMDVEGIELSI